ncbi:hypothetical protein JGU66_34470 [Myxococcaceae bacterium JPH2]|nr:hypothetical protein [Myxococcaceae bacterium JPH2]
MSRRLIVLSALSLAACTGPREGATAFPANYSPSDEVPPALRECAPSLVVSVADVRTDTSSVGQRFQEEKPDQKYPIQLQGDVTAYVRGAFESAFKRVRQVKPTANPGSLALRVTQFNIEEQVSRNAVYRGRATMDVSYVPAGASAPCWTGQITGSANNYGRAGSPENYQETISWSMDRAAAELFASKEFNDALCGKCAPPAKP